MPKLITKRFNLHVAEVFKNNITNEAVDNFYVFYSRIQPWANESLPPAPENTVQYTDYDIWRGMIGLKKISNNDVSFAISKNSWEANTAYAEYNTFDPQIYDRNYYVYTDENNVYKCLFNNNGGRSSIKPTGDSTSTIVTSDGYKWKFMYNITLAEQNKFESPNFIPVKFLDADDGSPQWNVQLAAANGALSIIDVSNGGNNYLVATGNFTSVTNTSIMTIANNAVGTDGTYTGYNMFISSGLGAGQQRRITNYRGTDRRVVLTSGFDLAPNANSVYHIAPAINITGDGSSATAYANVVSGAINEVTLINSGTRYSKAQATVVDYSSTGRGSGAVLSAYISPPGGHGSDPVKELGSTSVVINAQVDGTENSRIAANNEFRVYGLLKNPILRSTGALASSTRYNQTTRLTLTSVSADFTEDEFVIGNDSEATGRVVEFANTNAAGTQGVLKLVNLSGSFANSETITANTSGSTGIINSIQLSDLLPYKGQVLYTVNQSPISRDLDQTENITITVKF